MLLAAEDDELALNFDEMGCEMMKLIGQSFLFLFNDQRSMHVICLCIWDNDMARQDPVSYNLLSITSYTNCYKLLKSRHLIGCELICHRLLSFVIESFMKRGQGVQLRSRYCYSYSLQTMFNSDQLIGTRIFMFLDIIFSPFL